MLRGATAPSRALPSLKSANEPPLHSSLLFDDQGKSAAVGSKVEMYIPSSFGGNDNVNFMITGQTIDGSLSLYESETLLVIEGASSIQLSRKELIARNIFDDASVYQIVQQTKAIAFTVTQTISGSNSIASVTGDAQGSDVRVLSGSDREAFQVEAGGKLLKINRTIDNTGDLQLKYSAKVGDWTQELKIDPI